MIIAPRWGAIIGGKKMKSLLLKKIPIYLFSQGEEVIMYEEKFHDSRNIIDIITNVQWIRNRSICRPCGGLDKLYES
jgi:hypothetical protein